MITHVVQFTWSIPQVFTERGFLTRVLMASFDLTKLRGLDEEMTMVLNDMQVGVVLEGPL